MHRHRGIKVRLVVIPDTPNHERGLPHAKCHKSHNVSVFRSQNQTALSDFRFILELLFNPLQHMVYVHQSLSNCTKNAPEWGLAMGSGCGLVIGLVSVLEAEGSD